MQLQNGQRDQEKVTKKGKFGPYVSPISGRSLRRDVVETLAGGSKPPTGFCHKPYEVAEEPQRSAPHLLCTGHVIHSHKHTGELVKYSRKLVR